MSALPPIADIRQCRWDVRKVPVADLDTPPAAGNDAQPSAFVRHETTCILISTQTLRGELDDCCPSAAPRPWPLPRKVTSSSSPVAMATQAQSWSERSARSAQRWNSSAQTCCGARRCCERRARQRRGAGAGRDRDAQPLHGRWREKGKLPRQRAGQAGGDAARDHRHDPVPGLQCAFLTGQSIVVDGGKTAA
jgi:hypothetical protein